MKKHYDFSTGVQGKFYRPIDQLTIKGEPMMDLVSESEIDDLVGPEQLAAFQQYLVLTTYIQYVQGEAAYTAAYQDYATRDGTFPMELSIKE